MSVIVALAAGGAAPYATPIRLRGDVVSDTKAGANDEIGFLQAALSRWRLAAAIAATVALALFVVAVGDRMVPSVNPHMFLAVLTSANVAPAFVATVNLDSPTLVIRRLTDPPPADQQYVLWAVPAKGDVQSLGVLPAAEQLPLRYDRRRRPGGQPGTEGDGRSGRAERADRLPGQARRRQLSLLELRPPSGVS
jgi:anti-sigma-K factor RskA